jgi:hypothetical protein
MISGAYIKDVTLNHVDMKQRFSYIAHIKGEY